jgi:hypothetical protein
MPEKSLCKFKRKREEERGAEGRRRGIGPLWGRSQEQ